MITIYTTPTCAYCPMVKKLLDGKGIKYQTIDLDAQPEVRKSLYEKTGAMTVPQTQIGDKIIVGWNPGALMAALSSNV